MSTGIVAGGTGFIGRYLVEHWLKQNKKIIVVGRDKAKIDRVFLGRVESITWDHLQEHGASLIRNSEFILNLAGSNISAHRWTPAEKFLLLQSRVHTTNLISKVCASLGHASPPFLCADGIGVYGLQQTSPDLPPKLTETTEIHFDQHPEFIAKIGHDWEQATELAKTSGVPVVNLRFGVVLGKNGGALKKMQLPFQLGLGGPLGSGNQAYSWVHLHDLARAIDFILKQQPVLQGPVNIVSPQCVTQREFALQLGKALHRPARIPMPGFMAKLLFGSEMAEELLLNGQHVYPERLLQAGFTFQYPTLAQALAEIYQR